MGHNISGVIAEAALGARFASQYVITPPNALSDGLSFLPLWGRTANHALYV
jgi:hypothetical protein